MKVSDELRSQITRLQRTGAFAISTRAKQELKEHLEEIGARPLTNLSCGVCVRNAMYDLSKHIDKPQEKPKLQFKGVKDPKELSYKELRSTVKARGLLKKHMTKQEMINALCTTKN